MRRLLAAAALAVAAAPAAAQVDPAARGLAAKALAAAPVRQPSIANLSAAPTAADFNNLLTALRAAGIVTPPAVVAGSRLDFTDPANSAFIL